MRRASPARARVILAGLVISFGLPIRPASAAPAPAKAQVVTFGKIFKYVRTLSKDAPLRLIVVCKGEPTRDCRDFAALFDELQGVEAEAVSRAALASMQRSADVAYLRAGTAKSAALLRGKQILSITGTVDYVERGIAAVGLDLKDNKIRINIHRGTLDAENHKIASSVMRLANLIE